MDFSFVDDEELRQILARDFTEATKCLDAGLTIATTVMVGAVAEALLQYAVMTMGDDCEAVVKMSLSDLIRKCADAGAIDSTTTKACEILQSHRNLVHPGREVRTRQRVTVAEARASIELVKLIAGRISEYCNNQQPAARLAERYINDPECGVFLESFLSAATKL